uniref:Uncharacterized protein n=1 Tax=Cucumis melo TaxID=3656 RepID=A0A9I9EFZ0_CUCME
MRYMRDIITNGSIVVTYSIHTRTLYSQLDFDEVRMKLDEFLGGYMCYGGKLVLLIVDIGELVLIWYTFRLQIYFVYIHIDGKFRLLLEG